MPREDSILFIKLAVSVSGKFQKASCRINAGKTPPKWHHMREGGEGK